MDFSCQVCIGRNGRREGGYETHTTLHKSKGMVGCTEIEEVKVDWRIAAVNAGLRAAHKYNNSI